MPELALIGLGSNLGDRKALLDSAVASLSNTPGITLRSVSSYHETAAVGGPQRQGPFLNAAVALETTIEPIALLDRLNAIENEANRVRTVRWGERTLDLDLLLFGDRVIQTSRLTVPHPRMAFRRFVLAPLVEISPDAIHPETGMTITALLDNIDRRPSYVAMFRHRVDQKAIFRELVEKLWAIGLSSGIGEGAGDNPVGDWRWMESADHYLPLLEQVATELRRDRWSEDDWGDRWVVTDFWFDRIYLTARSSTAPSEFGSFHQRFLELRPQVIAPTMLVLDRRIQIAEVQGYFDDEYSPFPKIGRAVPTLRPDSDDPEEIATEIAAACQATRAG